MHPLDFAIEIPSTEKYGSVEATPPMFAEVFELMQMQRLFDHIINDCNTSIIGIYRTMKSASPQLA